MKYPLVSFFAATAATLSATAAWHEAPKLRDIPGIEKSFVVTATPEAPKHGEQSAVRLKDGRLLLLWSEFVREDLMPPGERPPPSPLRRDPTGDDGYARISGKTSADGGRTWSKPWVVVDDRDALVNCISPSLTRMADGRIILAYSWRSGGNHPDNYGNCAKMVRISADEGITWSERIYGQRSVLACAVSKDGGKTWGLPKALETDPELWSEYPGVTFDGDHALVHYRVFSLDRKRCDLDQARVPLKWFYDDTQY